MYKLFSITADSVLFLAMLLLYCIYTALYNDYVFLPTESKSLEGKASHLLFFCTALHIL